MVGILREHPVSPRTCNYLSVTHVNHAGVEKATKHHQLYVEMRMVSLTIPVDVRPLTLTNWSYNNPLLPIPDLWSQERASQPAKIELVTLYKN
jgi:hypothetical protein